MSAGSATLANPTSRDVRATAGAAGSCDLAVTVKDGNGIELGTGDGPVQRHHQPRDDQAVPGTEPSKPMMRTKKKLRAKQLTDEARRARAAET